MPAQAGRPGGAGYCTARVGVNRGVAEPEEAVEALVSFRRRQELKVKVRDCWLLHRADCILRISAHKGPPKPRYHLELYWDTYRKIAHRVGHGDARS